MCKTTCFGWFLYMLIIKGILLCLKLKPPSQLFYEINKYCEKNREMRYNRTKVPQTRKIKGNFWKAKIYGVFLTFPPVSGFSIIFQISIIKIYINGITTSF